MAFDFKKEYKEFYMPKNKPGILVSRIIRNGTEKSGIAADAVVSRIVDDGTQTDIDINVYVRYSTADGEEVEAILSNPPVRS